MLYLATTAIDTSSMLSPQSLFCAALLAAAAEAFSPAAPLALRAAKPAALASTRSAGLGRVVAPMARALPRRASHALTMAVSLPADTPLKVGIAGKESRLHIPIIAGASWRWPLCRWHQAYRSGRCLLHAARGVHVLHALTALVRYDMVTGATGAVGKEIVGALEKRGAFCAHAFAMLALSCALRPLSCPMPPSTAVQCICVLATHVPITCVRVPDIPCPCSGT